MTKEFRLDWHVVLFTDTNRAVPHFSHHTRKAARAMRASLIADGARCKIRVIHESQKAQLVLQHAGDL